MQHSIDLLPDSIRARGQAGLRTGRFIASSAAAPGPAIRSRMRRFRKRRIASVYRSTLTLDGAKFAAE